MDNYGSRHHTCFLGGKNSIGRGVRMARRCYISAWVNIGNNCTLGEYVYLEDNAKIGDGCELRDFVYLCSGVELENDVYCGPGCTIADGLPPRAWENILKNPGGARTTLVKRGSSIGAHAAIDGGVTVGEMAVISPGAVVTSDVPRHALMKGNPAVQCGWVCECGQVLPDDLVCGKCGRTYAAAAEGLTEIIPEN